MDAYLLTIAKKKWETKLDFAFLTDFAHLLLYNCLYILAATRDSSRKDFGFSQIPKNHFSGRKVTCVTRRNFNYVCANHHVNSLHNCGVTEGQQDKELTNKLTFINTYIIIKLL